MCFYTIISNILREQRLSPEAELLAKQAELETLNDQLARKELDLQTIRCVIDAFFRTYNFAIESQVIKTKETANSVTLLAWQSAVTATRTWLMARTSRQFDGRIYP